MFRNASRQVIGDTDVELASGASENVDEKSPRHEARWRRAFNMGSNLSYGPLPAPHRFAQGRGQGDILSSASPHSCLSASTGSIRAARFAG